MKRQLKVLIVEDSEPDARLLIRELKLAGYEVEHRRIETGEALQAALADGTWDVILCDYSLPNFSGIDALAMVRAAEQDLPVIFVSGKMGEDVAVEAMKSGANDYIMKGNLKRLVPAIERELREAGSRRELRAADAAVRRLTVAVESAANGIIITDRHGVILWTNPAFTEISGYPAEEALGQNPRLLKSGEHEPAFYWNLWEIILAGKVWRGEVTNRHKDGQLYTIEQTITPVRDQAGQISQFVSIAQDITERKQAETLLHKREQEFRALVENSPDAITRCDGQGRRVYVNPALEKLAGKPAAELAGKTPFEAPVPPWRWRLRCCKPSSWCWRGARLPR